MINVETIKFIEMLNVLAEKTTHGFMDWNSTDDADTINNFEGILFDSKNDNKVVLAKCVIGEECPHKDIIAYFDQDAICAHELIIVRVLLPEEEGDPEAYIGVSVVDRYTHNTILAFSIQNGRWEIEQF